MPVELPRLKILRLPTKRAFEADTISAFGGILISNKEITLGAAEAMKDLFFEVIIAPAFSSSALELLQKKKNRIILSQKSQIEEKPLVKSLLNGHIVQERDSKTDRV